MGLGAWMQKDMNGLLQKPRGEKMVVARWLNWKW